MRRARAVSGPARGKMEYVPALLLIGLGLVVGIGVMIGAAKIIGMLDPKEGRDK